MNTLSLNNLLKKEDFILLKKDLSLDSYKEKKLFLYKDFFLKEISNIKNKNLKNFLFLYIIENNISEVEINI